MTTGANVVYHDRGVRRPCLSIAVRVDEGVDVGPEPLSIDSRRATHPPEVAKQAAHVDVPVVSSVNCYGSATLPGWSSFPSEPPAPSGLYSGYEDGSFDP